MSCNSAIFLTGSGSNTVSEGSIIPLGNTVRRYGKNLKQEGTGIVAEGDGYYQVVANFTIVPSGIGVVGVSLLDDSVGVAVSQIYADTANEPVNLTVVGIIRNKCCNYRTFVEFELANGSGNVTQSSVTIMKM